MESGRRAVVTGANTGLGLASTVALAQAGWSVTLAVRSTDKGNAAADAVRRLVPAATLEVRRLDLAELASVREFAAGWQEPLPLLMNNAGVMLVPTLTLTADGFEQQMGVNHLGHHLLTALLLPVLSQARGRIVSLSSVVHRSAGRLDRGMGLTGTYTPMGGYRQAKLATLMFALELDGRLRRNGIPVTSVAAHPGWVTTDTRKPAERGDDPGPAVRASRRISQLLGASPRHGARSQVFAGTRPDLPGGMFYGPRFLLYGPPHVAAPARAALNLADATWLFEASAEMTGERLLS